MKTNAHSSHPRILACGIVAALATFLPAFCRADQLHLVVQVRGSDPNQTYNQFSSGGSMTKTFSGAYGSATGSVTYGSIDLEAHATADSTNFGWYADNASWDDTITINPTDPSLIGTTGVARFTYHLTGSVAVSGTPYNVNFGLNLPSGAQYSGGYTGSSTTYSGSQISDLGTVTDDVTFTFGTPFTITTGLGAGAALEYPSSTGDVSVSLRGAGFTAIAGGNTVGYNSVSSTGSAAARPVVAGGSLAGFTLTNTTAGKLGTQATILDGTANAAGTVTGSFVANPTGTALASDAFDLSGTDTSKYVLELTYDPATANALYGTENNLLLLWLNPSTNMWVNAVDGNTDLSGDPNTPLAHLGAYDPATDFQLGSYGLDIANHEVWAVIDHNSEFAVGQVVPEPSSWTALFGGLGMLLGFRRWKRRETTKV